MAPEILGLFVPSGSKSLPRIGMWSAADIWCVGETAFQLVAGEPSFPDMGTLTRYAFGRSEFPTFKLRHVMASPAMVDFVTATMIADYTQRPTAQTASGHEWLRDRQIPSVMRPLSLSGGRFDDRYICFTSPS